MYIIETCQIKAMIFALVNARQEVTKMWIDALRVAVIGFAVVFLTLSILSVSVKLMSFFCKRVEKKGGKQHEL